MRLVRSSEPYSDYGNVSGEGARRLLGAPAADLLLTAIRESVQNSWDARIETDRPRYMIRLRTLRASEHLALNESVFSDLSDDAVSPLRALLGRSQIRVMEIADFGTWGLTGPVRPSHVAKGQKSRFVSLMRNIGSPREQHSVSGGTYGYGKSSLFTLSRCQSVVVDSLARGSDGDAERRFMASRMGDEFFEGENAYTGRHWWGKPCEAYTVDPVGGDTAAELADGLGMPNRRDDSGTTILVLDPDLGGEEEDTADDLLGRAGGRIVKTLLWYFWPKMVATDQRDVPMDFDVFVEGEPYAIPHPDEAPPFNVFADALRKLHSDSRKCYSIWSQRPKQHLGTLAHAKDFREPRSGMVTTELAPVIPDPLHHVALMRPAELVVKYLPGNSLPDERFEWGGLFVCTSEETVEEAFAAAEPPTHDDWNPEHLPGGSWAKRYVRIGLKEIGERMKEIAPPVLGPAGDGSEGLAGAADALGKLVMPGEGDRAVNRRGGSGGSGGGVGKRGGVRLYGPAFQELRHDARGVYAVFSFALTGTDGVSVNLEARPVILADGTDRLALSPNGVEPTVLEWLVEGRSLGGGSTVEVELEHSTVSGQLAVRMPEGMVVDPGLRKVDTDGE